MKDSTGMLDEDKSSGPGWGGGREKEKTGCGGAFRNSAQTSSADNESEPEQLFVLAQVPLKLAHLPLTEVAQYRPVECQRA